MNELFRNACLVLCFVLLLTNSTVANAQDSSPKPPLTPERLEQLKDKADRFYQAGRMQEAFAIFNGILAKNGDEYSQYMSGYMMFLGQGTQANAEHGAAWMMVAANSGNGLLWEAANTVFLSLDRGARRDAHKIQRDLSFKYGRCAMKKRLVSQLENLARKPSRRRQPIDTTRVTAVYGIEALEAPRELTKARAKLNQHILNTSCFVTST